MKPKAIDAAPLLEGLGYGSPQDDGEHAIEVRAGLLRKGVPLSHPRNDMGECTDSHRQCKGVFDTASPGF